MGEGAPFFGGEGSGGEKEEGGRRKEDGRGSEGGRVIGGLCWWEVLGMC